MRHTYRVKSRNGPNGVALNLLASALTILTAIALLGTAAVLGDTSAMVVEAERHDHVVHEFYRAVNEALRSGDATSLERLLAPNFVFHAPSPHSTPNRAGLEHYLTSIHDTSPTFQLQVEEMVSDGERAVARVSGGSEAPGGFLGLALTATPSPWGQYDRFRIVDRQIVEMQSSAPAPVEFAPLTEVRLDLEADPQAIVFERLAASSREQREWGPLSGPRVLYVDAGTVTVDRMPPEPPRDVSLQRHGQRESPQVVSGTRVAVDAGEALFIPSEARFMVRHEAKDAGATAYAVALPRVHYSGPLQPQAPTVAGENGERRDDLKMVETFLDGVPGLDPHAGVTVAFGRAMLPAGATIAFDAAEGYTFMTVDIGALILTNERAPLSLNHLDTDTPRLIKPGDPFALHNLGDDEAAVFMVTVLPRTALATRASQ